GDEAARGTATFPRDAVVGGAFVIVAPISGGGVVSIPPTFQQPRLARSAASAWSAGPAALSAAFGPMASAVPLGLGLTGAIPLTWLQLRLRRRLSRSARRGRPPPRPGWRHSLPRRAGRLAARDPRAPGPRGRPA